MKTILVTGGYGFVASNFIVRLQTDVDTRGKPVLMKNMTGFQRSKIKKSPTITKKSLIPFWNELTSKKTN